jgi:LPXTG-motif cell wall-anchored protein
MSLEDHWPDRNERDAQRGIRLPSTGNHRLDWFIVLAIAIVLLIIFV